jgi:hypothetical protein
MFKKYMHVERFGNDEVQGIELGECYVFPKIDGTNASLWFHDNEVCGGSRTRQLSIEKDNAGFYKECLFDSRYENWFKKYPNLRLYGEWLVPHSLKTYREGAWRKFYVFDVLNDETDQLLRYDDYKPLLEEFGIDYLCPMKIIKNGTYDHFLHEVNNNFFLIEDGAGVGEGVVLKNYEFYNRFGRQTWAKIVTSEFKELNYKAFGAPTTEKILVEEAIVEKYVTHTLVDKTYAKIYNDCNGWTSKYIPRLLETVYHELVVEELWSALKEHKNPTINFTTLKHFAIARIKRLKPEVF